MLKLLCVLFISFAVGYAIVKKTDITWAVILNGMDDPAITIEKNFLETEFTWNEPVNAQSNYMASFAIKFIKLNKIISIDLKNLCGTYKDDTIDKSAQTFILKTIADVTSCPIKKGTKAKFTVPSSFTYSEKENDHLCGRFRSEFQVFRRRDNGNKKPLIIASFKGNITGCEES